MLGLGFTLAALFFYFTGRSKFISIVILFVLISSGFQILPYDLFILQSVGISKSYDWILLFIISSLLISPKIYFKNKLLNIFPQIKWLLGLYLFIATYSCFYTGIETNIVIRTMRMFLIISIVFPLAMLRLEEFKKALPYIVAFSTLSSLIYLMQPFTKQALLNGVSLAAENIRPKNEYGILRFYNLPVFTMPVVLVMLIEKSLFRYDWKNKLYLGINLASIIISQHRNLILSVAIACLLGYLIKFRVSKLRKLSIVSIFVSLILLTNLLTDGRISDGLSEINSITKSNLKLENLDLNNVSTSEFRLYHVYERFNYIFHSDNFLINFFGLGFINEDSNIVASLNFNVGLLNEETKEIYQISTGDILWSLYFIYFGIIGTLLYFIIFYSVGKTLFSDRRKNIALIGFLYLLTCLLISFYSSEFIMSHHSLFLSFIIAYYYKTAYGQSINYNSFLQPRTFY